MRKLLHTLRSILRLQVCPIKCEYFLDLSISCPQIAIKFYTTCLFLFFLLKASKLLALCTSGNMTYETSVVCDNNICSNTGTERLFWFAFCVGQWTNTSQFTVALKSMDGNSLLTCCRRNSSVEDCLLSFCTYLMLDLLPGWITLLLWFFFFLLLKRMCL